MNNPTKGTAPPTGAEPIRSLADHPTTSRLSDVADNRENRTRLQMRALWRSGEALTDQTAHSEMVRLARTLTGSDA